jgi:hypothetical protein
MALRAAGKNEEAERLRMKIAERVNNGYPHGFEHHYWRPVACGTLRSHRRGVEATRPSEEDDGMPSVAPIARIHRSYSPFFVSRRRASADTSGDGSLASR